MIAPKCFTAEFIKECRNRLGCNNPILLEKAIVALQLVAHLVEANLPFQFKGGTSLLLLVQPIRRLSIDADIVTQASPAELEAVLKRIGSLQPFHHIEHDEARDRDLPPKKHYRAFYPSVFPPPENYVLLDVLFETAQPAEQVIIKTEFILPERDVWVSVPGINGLLGEKLTAFAPQTIGIIYHPERSADIIKQLFDVGVLFDVATDLAAAANTYAKVFADQCRYRSKAELTLNDTLNDTIQACMELSQHDLKGAPKEGTNGPFFYDGIEKLQGHLLSPFRRDQARIAAGKVACVAAWMKRRPPEVLIDTLRFTTEKIRIIADKSIHAPWTPLHRLKKGNPEAFFYWWQAQRLLNGENPP